MTRTRAKEIVTVSVGIAGVLGIVRIAATPSGWLWTTLEATVFAAFVLGVATGSAERGRIAAHLLDHPSRACLLPGREG